jgi:hypothetical protein
LAEARFGSARLTSDDPRYRAVIDKQFDKRFTAHPDFVRIASSTDEIVSAVDDAVREGKRLVVTSGGHCLEGFVSDPAVRVIIDVSSVKRIYYDAEMGAVAVEAGATVAVTGFARQARAATIPPRCCRTRRNQSRRSKRNGIGATSIARRFLGFFEITVSGASKTAVPIRRTLRSGHCWRFIASSSGRSSFAA